MRLAAALLAAASLIGAVAGGAGGATLAARATVAAAADPIPLEGAVVTGSPITLVTADGAQVRHLDPGVYTLLIHEQSRDGFHLAGPGVNLLTSPASPGDSRWTVTLTNGTYYVFADPGSEFNLWSFTVGTPPPVATTSAGAATTAAATTVAAKAPVKAPAKTPAKARVARKPAPKPPAAPAATPGGRTSR